MMSLMSKLLMSILIVTLSLNAETVPSEKELLKYIKRNVVKNPRVKVNGITVIEQKTHKDLPGWTVLLTTMNLVYQGKKINAPETIFIKEGLITGRLANVKTGRDYRKEIKPTVPESMYDDAHLTFGKKNAAHKVLIFSDPQCPFCQEVVPDIFKAAQENPTKLAIYYYHLPLLQIHPVSDVLTRVMLVAQHEGKMEILSKVYAMKIDPKETETDIILSEVKKQTGYSVTAEEINSKKVRDILKADKSAAVKLMVRGTPTVFIDGKWDKMRNGYKKLIK
ncbi:MAG: DsbA family protein [Sulfurimonas sp.]